MANVSAEMVEYRLQQAHQHLQRRKDQTDEIARLTRLLEMMTSLNCDLRAQLDSTRKDRDTWREQAQTLAKQHAAEPEAKTEASNEAAT
jgi:hypothetical protein